MKTVLLISLLSLFSFKQEEEQVTVNIEGNPSCISINKEYKVNVSVKEEKFADLIVVSAMGATIKPNGGYLSYDVSTEGGLEEIRINVGIKDQETGKVNYIKRASFSVCQE